MNKTIKESHCWYRSLILPVLPLNKPLKIEIGRSTVYKAGKQYLLLQGDHARKIPIINLSNLEPIGASVGESIYEQLEEGNFYRLPKFKIAGIVKKDFKKFIRMNVLASDHAFDSDSIDVHKWMINYWGLLDDLFLLYKYNHTTKLLSDIIPRQTNRYQILKSNVG
jgi:hypothetical protein